MNKILLKNAFIHPITRGCFFGDVLVGNGMILDIGFTLTADMKTNVLDCAGLYLFPGFIDVHTHLGLYNEGIGWAGTDANETTESVTPHVRAMDGVYPLDPAFLEAVKAGITTVNILPGSSNIIGGTTSVIKTYGSNIRKMIVKETSGLKIALGENPKHFHSFDSKNSLTRMGIMGKLREIFYNVQYGKDSQSFRMAPILKALKREIPVRIHAHRADDILSAIRFAEEFHLDLRIEHCTEGHLISNELAEYNRILKVAVGPTLTRRSKNELKNKSWLTYQELSKKNIEVSITTDHPYIPIQYLNICAAIAVREGLSEEQALRGLTILPARNLGLEHRIGSIDIGKDADLVLWSHHPFHFMAKPAWTMINGEFANETNKKAHDNLS
nr:amidohydrolase [uncultured Bacillus sp.]